MQGTPPVASMELRAELGARLQMQAEAQEVALDEDQGAATAIELIVARNDALAGEAAAASRLAALRGEELQMSLVCQPCSAVVPAGGMERAGADIVSPSSATPAKLMPAPDELAVSPVFEQSEPADTVQEHQRKPPLLTQSGAAAANDRALGMSLAMFLGEVVYKPLTEHLDELGVRTVEDLLDLTPAAIEALACELDPENSRLQRIACRFKQAVARVQANDGAELIRAIDDGRDNEVKVMLALGADPNHVSRGAWAGVHTALMSAVACGKPQLVRLLLDHKADVNAVPDPNTGISAWHEACRKGYIICAAELVVSGCDTGLRTKSGSTGLDLVVQHGHAELLSVFDPQSSADLPTWRCCSRGLHSSCGTQQSTTRSSRHDQPKAHTE